MNLTISWPKGLAGKRLHVACLLTALFVGGCATVPQGVTPSVGTPVSAPVYRDAIELGGRLSIHYRQRDQDEALHGSFQWAQSSDHTVVTLLSPLGQIVATIDLTANTATLTQAGKPPRSASNVDELVANSLGWPLPISGMRRWLQGFVTDTKGQEISATPQMPDAIMTRDGWRIRYASWQDDATAASKTRPKRIDLDRTTNEAGDVAIRVVLDTWQAR